MDLRAYLDTDGTWRVDNVPVVTTGIEYPLASGPKTFTEEDLADIILSQGDPAIKPPRIKLGHTSEYNAALVGDAEQAFGRVDNLRVGNHGQTVYGDYIGMPEWLAKVLPIAYPSRSIEGWPDVETNTGKSYRAVVSAVALLGVQWPGVSTLDDLPLYFGADVPPGVVVPEILLDGAAIAATTGGGMKPGERIRAAVDIDLVERAFYTEIATGDDYWWWIRAERFDDSSGLQLIVDRDDGTLVRMPVSVNGSDITFGDPVEVTEEYPDRAPVAAAALVAGMAIVERERGADVLIHASRADTTQDRPAIKATSGGGVMDDATRRALATRVGLDPESATEDEINAKIDEMRTTAESPEGEPEGQPSGDPANQPEGEPEGQPEGEPANQPEGEPAAPVEAGRGDGPVTLDRDTFNKLQAGAEAGSRLAAEQVARDDNDFISNAIKAGKFAPSRREHYLKLMQADREGTRQLIDGLFEGTIPVTERGSAGGTGEVAGGGDANDGLMGMDPSLDRDIRAARERAVAPRERVTQAKEG